MNPAAGYIRLTWLSGYSEAGKFAYSGYQFLIHAADVWPHFLSHGGDKRDQSLFRPFRYDFHPTVRQIADEAADFREPPGNINSGKAKPDTMNVAGEICLDPYVFSHVCLLKR
jgi:hypothetical protein